jgi:hypothetical protein
MFLLSIFTGVSKSNTEDFLVRNLLVGELKYLFDGVDMTINGKHYFVQVRMILTMLDTKAVEEFLKVQTCGASVGCFMCKNGKGYNNGVHMCIIGHRKYLPLTHKLRAFGQSQHCCPKRYYDEKGQTLEPHDPLNLDRKVRQCDLPKYKSTELIVCDMVNSERIRTYLSSRAPWTWEFPEVDMTIFEKSLYFHHADYRPYIEYERKTNQSYLENGKKGRENKKNFPNKKKVQWCVDGVYDNWAMSELKYVDITRDLCWGPMHVLMNIGDNIISNWKNERAHGPKIVKYCKTTGMHPNLYTDNISDQNQKKAKKKEKANKDHPPQNWNIKKSIQDKVFIM